MWPGNHANLLWEQPGLSLGVTGTEEDDTIPALVKLRFSTGLVPRGTVEGVQALEPDFSLATWP